MAAFNESSVHRGRQEVTVRTPSSPDLAARRATKSDGRFQLFAKRVQDRAILLLDPEGYVTTWNEGAARIEGFGAEEIIGRHVSGFYTAEDVERGLPARLLRTAATQGQAESEGWRVRKDGSRFWAEVSITALRDNRGRLQGFGEVTRDRTEQKQAEEKQTEQVLRELSGRVVEAVDSERRRISLSLNDSTSPSLTALISKLHAAKHRPEGSQLIDDCIGLAEFVSRAIRTASYLLYPPSLETDGLLVTLSAHLKGLARQKGTPIDLDFPPRLERLPPTTAAALYRVVQEFLASIFRVPGNSRARVRVALQGGRLVLEVAAEGRGLPEEALQEARRGVGELGVTMAGMRERIVRLGGSLELDSSKSGTWVTAVVPIPRT